MTGSSPEPASLKYLGDIKGANMKKLPNLIPRPTRREPLPENLMKHVRIFLDDPTLTAEQHAIQLGLVDFYRWRHHKFRDTREFIPNPELGKSAKGYTITSPLRYNKRAKPSSERKDGESQQHQKPEESRKA